MGAELVNGRLPELVDGPAFPEFDSICGVGLFTIAATAALTTCMRGGFMPQARHGGSGVCAFAVTGSKFDGTGLEKEQMGHTHVAFSVGTGAGTGLPYRAGGVKERLVVEVPLRTEGVALL